MNLHIADRVALVVGGSSGIGRAVAVTLAREGAKVMICARQKNALSVTVGSIRRFSSHVDSISADVTNLADAKKVVAHTAATYGALDFVINCAGGVKTFGDMNRLSSADWIDAYRQNVLSVVNITKCAVPHLKKSDQARVITIASISGIQPGRYNPHYGSAKAAVINVTKYLANVYAEDKILVNTVCPGPVHSSSWERNIRFVSKVRRMTFTDTKREFELTEAAKIPLGRVGEGEDIAGIVAFLCSDLASWITGSCFHVNGGKLSTMV